MHLVHTPHSKQAGNLPFDSEESNEKQCRSQKKLKEIYELALKNQNDIKLLKKQHEEMKHQFALFNDTINSQLLNLSSLFSSLSIQSTSNGIQLHDFLQNTKEDIENSRKMIEEVSEKSSAYFKLTVQKSLEGEKTNKTF